MRLISIAPAVLLLTVLAGCTPSLNWRDVRAEPGALAALLPCKPDRGQRSVQLAGHSTPMQMVGCEADGALFAIASAPLPPGTPPDVALTQWRQATLAHLQASAPVLRPLAVPGGLPLAAAVHASANGRRADGTEVQTQAAYFAHGTQVYQAVVYANRLQPEATETFFSSLKFQ